MDSGNLLGNVSVRSMDGGEMCELADIAEANVLFSATNSTSVEELNVRPELGEKIAVETAKLEAIANQFKAMVRNVLVLRQNLLNSVKSESSSNIQSTPQSQRRLKFRTTSKMSKVGVHNENKVKLISPSIDGGSEHAEPTQLDEVSEKVELDPAAKMPSFNRFMRRHISAGSYFEQNEKSSIFKPICSQNEFNSGDLGDDLEEDNTSCDKMEI